MNKILYKNKSSQKNYVYIYIKKIYIKYVFTNLKTKKHIYIYKYYILSRFKGNALVVPQNRDGHTRRAL